MRMISKEFKANDFMKLFFRAVLALFPLRHKTNFVLHPSSGPIRPVIIRTGKYYQ